MRKPIVLAVTGPVEYNVTLDDDTARVLFFVLGRVGGALGVNAPRTAMTALRTALYDAGATNPDHIYAGGSIFIYDENPANVPAK